MSIKEVIVTHYKDRVAPERKSFDILDWGSEEEQFLRFQILVNHLKQLGFSRNFKVLDVGCGLGDLEKVLLNEFSDIHYTGTDLTFEIAKEAVRRSPHLHVVCADLNESFPFPENFFNLVFASGVFNLRLDNHEHFIKTAIKHMLEVSQDGVMVNFLHRRIAKQYDYCYYTSPEQIRKLCKQIPANITIIDNYLEKDFSVWFSK